MKLKELSKKTLQEMVSECVHMFMTSMDFESSGVRGTQEKEKEINKGVVRKLSAAFSQKGEDTIELFPFYDLLSNAIAKSTIEKTHFIELLGPDNSVLESIVLDLERRVRMVMPVPLIDEMLLKHGIDACEDQVMPEMLKLLDYNISDGNSNPSTSVKKKIEYWFSQWVGDHRSRMFYPYQCGDTVFIVSEYAILAILPSVDDEEEDDDDRKLMFATLLLKDIFKFDVEAQENPETFISICSPEIAADDFMRMRMGLEYLNNHATLKSDSDGNQIFCLPWK